MSIKITTVFYPHIVKEYSTVSQIVTENGYDDFYAWHRNLVSQYVDITSEAVYKEGLTEDSFEGVTTVVFPTQEAFNSYEVAAEADSGQAELKQPIYSEASDTHLI
jgi:hypothetical protein